MRSVAVIAALIVISLISGCGLLPEEKDETIGWSANKLYAEARDALNDGSYAKSIKYFAILTVATHNKRRSTLPTPTGKTRSPLQRLPLVIASSSYIRITRMSTTSTTCVG